MRFLLAAVLVLPLLAQQQDVSPKLAPIEDVTGLPRVLIIGDSISIGYTLPLREALRGVANLHRPAENCQSTIEGLERLDKWLGEKPWDVIHFNFGLHDLKYIDGAGRRVSPDAGEQKVPLDEYERNLDQIVRRLKQTGAKLFWRPTTPVPQGAFGRVPGDGIRYNEAALRVMRRHHVAVDDLNAFITRESIPHIKPDDVHFSDESSARLAAHIAAKIRTALQ